MGMKDIVGGGIFAALGIFILFTTAHFPSLEHGHPGPSLFPNVLAILFICFGAVVVYHGWRPGKKDLENAEEVGVPAEINYFNPVFVLILMVVFIVLSNWLGFILTASLILFLLMMKLKVSFLRSLTVAILLALFVNFMFAKILRVPLPMGLFGW